MDELMRIQYGQYKWPEHAQQLLHREIEVLNGLEQVVSDLAILCRAHFSSASARALEQAGHDVAHALQHMEKTEQTLQRIYDERSKIT